MINPAPSAASAIRADVVPLRIPWITPWTGEKPVEPRLYVPHNERRLALRDERASERDAFGTLLHPGRLPVPVGRGRGEPEHSSVHPARQREAMQELLCMGCACPADRTGDGVLWLLGHHTAAAGDWLKEVVTVLPPVCLPCVPVVADRRPELAGGYMAVRVDDPNHFGYVGDLYARKASGPASLQLVEEGLLVEHGDPRLPWMLCTQIALRLTGCTVIDLSAEPRTRRDTVVTRRAGVCVHRPACPAADAADHAAARVVEHRPEQGYAVLCNGVVLFEDGGESLPDGRAVGPRRAAPTMRKAAAA
ncbi:DUF5999 family protein [Streptomyces sp. NPDC055078]